MRVLQLNLNHCEAAQDLCWQTISEKSIDVAMLCEQYRDVEGSSFWMNDNTGRAAIWVKKGHFVQESQRTRTNGFVWVKVADIYFCSAYAAPSATQDEYEVLLDRIEQEMRGRQPLVIAGDFNAWATVWGSRKTNRRGGGVLDLISTLDLVLLNTGLTPTFLKNGNTSIIDLTFVSANLASNDNKWHVSDHYTHSDHQAIYFEVFIPGAIRKKVKPKKAVWNNRSFDRDSFAAMIQGKVELRGTVEEKVSQLMQFITDGCDASMTKTSNRSRHMAVYWWTEEISILRRTCLRTRRAAQRARGRSSYDARQQEHKVAKRNLVRAIKGSKLNSWKKLCEEVDEDTWGRPYKIVMTKLKGSNLTSPSSPERLLEIVESLFPRRPETVFHNIQVQDLEQVPEITQEELDLACCKIGDSKAPGPDSVPNKALKLAIQMRSKLFLDTYSSCLREGIFPSRWKKQHLVLLPKGKGPPKDATCYRPICLLDSAGKVLERIVYGRLTGFYEGVDGLSNNQYGFRKSRSTIDAIDRVIKTAQEAIAGKRWRRGSKKYCAIITLDVRNAFNSARWDYIMQGLRKTGVPQYLRRIIGSYFTDRILRYETEDGLKTYKITGGVPQGSVLGPLLWNVMYDEVLRLPLERDTTTIAFADDLAIIVCGKLIEDVTYTANKAIFSIRQWLSSVGLQLADHKTEAVLITSRKVRETIELTVGGFDIRSKPSIRYLGVQIDARLRFDEHLDMVSCKAARVNNALARIMPNVGGPSQNRRRLLASVTSSTLLYAAPIWMSAFRVRSYARGANSVYRRSALRVVRAFRTVSYEAACVISDMPPVDLLADERNRLYRRKREDPDAHWEMLGKQERAITLERWQRRWDAASTGRWTHRLIPDIVEWLSRKHGEVDYYLTQLLTGHGCFRAYLARFKLEEQSSCPTCTAIDETVEHVFFYCPRFGNEKEELDKILGQKSLPENIVTQMRTKQECWAAVADYAAQIGRALRKQERDRRGQAVG